jgi:hypothetical protein
MQKENKLTKNFIIGTFVTLYVMVSIISTIHVIDFFELSNPKWLAVTLAIAFEVGAAASLASIIALKKMNKGIVWALFILLTLMQAMGNTYYAFVNLKGFEGWIELFGLIDEDPVQQKRIVSFISGAVLPLVALGFIKSLVDYIRPEESEEKEEVIVETTTDNGGDEQIIEVVENSLKEEAQKVWEKVAELREEGKLPPPLTEEELKDEPTALANSQYSEMVSEEEYDEEPINNFEEKSLIEMQGQIEESVTNLEVETEDIAVEDKENYPVYDNSNDVAKNNALDNIMVFTKNAG